MVNCPKCQAPEQEAGLRDGKWTNIFTNIWKRTMSGKERSFREYACLKCGHKWEEAVK